MKSIKEYIYKEEEFKDIFECIKYDIFTKQVEYNDVEYGVNTSVKDNPTLDTTEIYPNVEVWSVFQRQNTPDATKYFNKDGNPLLYAFKKENGWRFKTKDDKKKFISLFEQIVEKFLKEHKSDITVLIPSGNALNTMIANTIKKKNTKVEIVYDLLRKLSIEEVANSMLKKDSPFMKTYNTKSSFESALKDMKKSFERMEKYRDGKFTYHFLNQEFREVITNTLAADEFSRGKNADKIYNKNVLLIDDSISMGQTIKSACDIIKTFEPKSITVLTMFSKKKDIF